ncbi:50S ribosomal protein L16 [Deferribacter desulfuricans SSM1]|uniref:Large ribosomal subunit protein uL16 n=1 Tax=Deferribacter desulfuricans (strain DSM 14783 / JCM 11476 / NBRC 101012 / SSM1) TaxID=639282 RepID=D3P930_DEFDS|nr:50S ribosomal protein L16 [Deferribacter desulfuricans]BAI81220.1 50S ribosomal protein L16 [Deferribacter desulfuricans SSM1]
MLMPKRLKYRKVFKGRIKGKATKGNKIEFGEYGLQSMSKGKITSRQIEAARIAITRYVKRGGKVIIRIFPHKPVTKKPAETRMGKGKGAVEYYVAPVKEGTMLYEISGVTEAQAREAFRLASHKLPVKCKFVKKSDFEKEGE